MNHGACNSSTGTDVFSPTQEFSPGGLFGLTSWPECGKSLSLTFASDWVWAPPGAATESGTCTPGSAASCGALPPAPAPVAMRFSPMVLLFKQPDPVLTAAQWEGARNVISSTCSLT